MVSPSLVSPNQLTLSEEMTVHVRLQLEISQINQMTLTNGRVFFVLALLVRPSSYY